MNQATASPPPDPTTPKVAVPEAPPADPPMNLRPASALDIDQLAELEDQAFGVEAWSRQLLMAELTGPHRHYLVIESGGSIIGYAGLFLGLDEAEVMTIAVAPAARGRGLGRWLMEALLDRARAAAPRKVMLEVAADSEPARRLYRSLGFQPVGRRRGYYQPSGRDALVMRLDL
jgi:ribosomal-protein-alanine N-acetyltransferase